jgi:hypothetical protein
MPRAKLNDRAQVEFFRLGMHYYVTGRFAALSGLFPMAGNLLQHAIGMFLKDTLVQPASLDAVRNMGHDLSKLWVAFKAASPSPDAASFDLAIEELNRFERIRYPDKVIREGMEASFTVFREQRVESVGPSAPLPSYTLVLEDIDALTKFLFDNANVNPQFHLQHLRGDGREFLSRHNRHSLG